MLFDHWTDIERDRNYRATCRCTWAGPSRDSRDEALSDAKLHKADAGARPAALTETVTAQWSADEIETMAEEFMAENHECWPRDPWGDPPDRTCRDCGKIVP
jgi:hypothetical protein